MIKLIAVAIGIILGGSVAVSKPEQTGIRLAVAAAVAVILGFVVFTAE